MPSNRALKYGKVPSTIIDRVNNKEYHKGNFLGQGGFAICFELTDVATKQKYAGKIILKSDLKRTSQKQKFNQEIEIHRSLTHEHIVGFHSSFEDAEFHYILLELCNRFSLMELHKRRKVVTEPEARYFLRHVILGCAYLHQSRIIHRDLKLANLFLNDNMCVKLGDFGLATRINVKEEKKKTLCGTPNYIAPEILFKQGHSFEVDLWSLGCILYTLLAGRPPFETNDLTSTYNKIKENDYVIPPTLSPLASSLIRDLLNPIPYKRPKITKLLDYDFFKEYIPNCLPVSALTTLPRLQPTRNPLAPINATGISQDDADIHMSLFAPPADCWLSVLYDKITILVKETAMLPVPDQPDTEPPYLQAMQDSEDPACIPIYWISKWVDYSDKYGLGYQLCDNSFGVVFNDVTRLLLTANEQHLQYIEGNGVERLFTIDAYPETLTKKVTLLKYFIAYMHEHLLKAGGNISRQEVDAMSRLPFVRKWVRTSHAIAFHLSNGTLQVNFLKDHAKIVLCPLMRAVTYIDAGRDFKTYRFKLLRKNGMIPIVEKRLRYALKMIDFFIKPQATVVAASTATASGSSANTGMTPIAYAPDCRFQQVPPATGNQARENFPPEKHPATSAASHPTSAVSVPQPR